MRIASTLFAVVFLASCTTTPLGPASSGAVAAATAAWVDAYNSRDPERIVAQYDRDAVLWGTTSKTIAKTPEQVWDYFKEARSRPNARVVVTDQNTRVSGDMAVNAGSYTFSDVRDGVRQDNPARFTLVFRLREGKWRIVHHHSSRVP